MEIFSALLAFVRGIRRSPVNSPHKWHGALMFTLICACIDGWVNNRKAGDVRRHRIHYDVTVKMLHFKVVNDAVIVWIPHVCIPIHILRLTHTLRRTPTNNTIMLNHYVETPYFLAHGKNTVLRRHDCMYQIFLLTTPLSPCNSRYVVLLPSHL